MLLALLVACGDPTDTAIAACQAVPTLSPGPESVALLEPLLTKAEVDVVKKATPTLGMKQFGDATLGPLRQQTTCTVTDVQDAGSGAWAVSLSRSQPTIEPDGTLGAVKESPLEWMASKTRDGIRMEVGLQKAASMRASAEKAAKEGDIKRVAATWRTISHTFSDPYSVIDLQAAEAYQARTELAGKLEAAFARVEDGDVVGKVKNPTDAPVSATAVMFTFKAEGEDSIEVPVTTGPIPAGGEIEVRTPIPEAIDATVVVKVVEAAP